MEKLTLSSFIMFVFRHDLVMKKFSASTRTNLIILSLMTEAASELKISKVLNISNLFFFFNLIVPNA